jgi:tetratricopeptide (TPR) repeat protein
MRRLSICLLLAAFALPAFAQPSPTGRWLFNGLTESGKRVPLFIIEFTASAPGGATLVASSAPFPVVVEKATFEGERVVIDLVVDQKKLTLEGTSSGTAIRGKASGATLRGLTFLAEPTQLTELKKPQPPEPEELEAYQSAGAIADPAQRIEKLRELLTKWPNSALKSVSLVEIFSALLATSAKEEDLLKTGAEVIKSTNDPGTAMNELAFGLAEQGILLDKAEEWARSAIQLSVPGTNTRADFTDTLGWVLFKKNKFPEATATLREALSISPRKSDIALHLAEALEKQNLEEEAAEAYLMAYVGGARLALAKAQELYKAHNGSLDGFHALMDEQYAKLPPPFDAGRYQGDYGGPAIVAELFTGAQCGPCQSADYAFDGLIDHFPAKVLTVLEYHLHVPGPDPMTNPQAAARAEFYKLRSTPVAIFSGTEQQPGGGRRTLSEAAFQQYRGAIEKQLQQERKVSLQLTAEKIKDAIHVSGQVRLPDAAPEAAVQDQLRLFLVLVEKAVHYSGANGVHIHRNVVRKMLNGPQGERLPGGEFTFERTTEIGEIEREQQTYLDRLTQEWGLPFPDAPTTLNRDQLVVAAFVQNLQTQEILGSVTAEVQ